jgi:hypothetical protein
VLCSCAVLVFQLYMLVYPVCVVRIVRIVHVSFTKTFNYSSDVIFALLDRGGGEDTVRPSSSVTAVKENNTKNSTKDKIASCYRCAPLADLSDQEE